MRYFLPEWKVERIKKLVPEGLSRLAIAERLNIAPGTVDFYVERFGLTLSTCPLPFGLP